jgi:DNA-binding NtrC family response regulator
MIIENLDVVLVDDEQSILDAMQILLNQWGCRCHVFTTIEEAEQSLKHNIPEVDIIISDYHI